MKSYNFSAGPSALFPQVVETIKNDLFNWRNTGCSVFEISHRSPEFMDLYRELIANLRSLMQIPEDYEVLLFQGGARGQFESFAQNLKLTHNKAVYLNSGHWSRTASKLAAKQVPQLEVVTHDLLNAEGKLAKTDWTADTAGADYVHYCVNETVDGVEIFNYLTVAPGVTLIGDISSDILSRQIDVTKFDVLYAGAQKNIGVSGLTLVIVKKSLLGHSTALEILNWDIAAKNDSMINTPCTFAMYCCNLTLEHIINAFGGVANLAKQNNEKAELLYGYLDSSDFYSNSVSPEVRSKMNVVFRTPSPELDAEFVAQAKASGLYYLKGHKVVGGLRASIYNSVDLEAVKTLIAFMEKFAQEHK